MKIHKETVDLDGLISVNRACFIFVLGPKLSVSFRNQ